MSGVLCATLGGFPNCLGSATVTVGYLSLGTSPNNIDFWGFVNLGSYPGSVSPTTWADTGLPIVDLDYRISYSTYAQSVVFIVNGYAPNAGWDTLTIDGINYSRSTATYAYGISGTQTAWGWDASVTGNPFGYGIGATKAVTWS